VSRHLSSRFSDAVGNPHTLSVPLVHRVPGPLAAVLHVPDLGETGTGNAEELYLYILVCWFYGMGEVLGNPGWSYGKLRDLVSIESSRSQKRASVASYHNPVREESFERDTHIGGGIVIVT
jgi:hypothetical protein